jgi:transcriptional antiterminator NusG
MFQVLVPLKVVIKRGKKIVKDKVYFPVMLWLKPTCWWNTSYYQVYNKCYYWFLGEIKGGEPVPLRISEVNRMLGKVDDWL